MQAAFLAVSGKIGQQAEEDLRFPRVYPTVMLASIDRSGSSLVAESYWHSGEKLLPDP